MSKEIFHFIYRTTSLTGKYYIGRHSTTNINDRYIGSGKWVKSIKYKSTLSREVLEFAESIEQLRQLEKQYLKEHVGKKNCMNFNNESIGFASGDINPSSTEEGRLRLSVQGKARNKETWPRGEEHWTKNNLENSVKMSKFLKENNPSKNQETMSKIAAKTSARMKINNPMFNPITRLLISKNGNFTKNNPARVEYVCPYCNKIGKGGRFKSHHLLKQNCMENNKDEY